MYEKKLEKKTTFFSRRIFFCFSLPHKAEIRHTNICYVVSQKPRFLLKYFGTFFPDCALLPIQKSISSKVRIFDPICHVSPFDKSINGILMRRTFQSNQLSQPNLPIARDGRILNVLFLKIK